MHPLHHKLIANPPAAAPASVIANTDQLLSQKEQARRHAAGQGAAWRLRMDAAIDMAFGKNVGRRMMGVVMMAKPCLGLTIWLAGKLPIRHNLAMW